MKNSLFFSKKSQNTCKNSSLVLKEKIFHEESSFLPQNQKFHILKFAFYSFGTDFTCEIKYLEL